MQWTDRIGRRLKPRDLHVFMVVAEQGSMAEAAERLSISRPVVSRTIAQLEDTLGVPLLDRTPQGVAPTLYGRALLARSVSIFDEMRQSVEELEFLASPGTGEVRIGCPETLAAGVVSAVIRKASGKYPGLAFHTELGTAPELQSHYLRERKCELVIARMSAPEASSDMDAEVLFFEQLHIVVGLQSKLPRRRKIGLKDLAGEAWILAPAEREPGGPVFEAFRALGLDPPLARISSSSLNLRHGLLASGNYVTCLPNSVLQFGAGHTLHRVLPIPLPRWRLPVAIITLKHRTLSPPAQLFIECTRETVTELTEAR
jgi:DNA-binding transcriptional LysR family regulator